MSTHDRGAFGALLAEAKALGCKRVSWQVDLDEPDESEARWVVETFPLHWTWKLTNAADRGRTGEEALRRLVEKLRVARGESQA